MTKKRKIRFNLQIDKHGIYAYNRRYKISIFERGDDLDLVKKKCFAALIVAMNGKGEAPPNFLSELLFVDLTNYKRSAAQTKALGRGIVKWRTHGAQYSFNPSNFKRESLTDAELLQLDLINGMIARFVRNFDDNTKLLGFKTTKDKQAA